jgi:hypothetical protein
VRPKIAVTWADIASQPSKADSFVPAGSSSYAALQRRVQDLESQVCALREQLRQNQQNRPVVNTTVEKKGAVAVAAAMIPGAAPAGQKAMRQKRRSRKSKPELQKPVKADAKASVQIQEPVAVAPVQQQQQPVELAFATWRQLHDEIANSMDCGRWSAFGKQQAREWLALKRKNRWSCLGAGNPKLPCGSAYLPAGCGGCYVEFQMGLMNDHPDGLTF